MADKPEYTSPGETESGKLILVSLLGHNRQLRVQSNVSTQRLRQQVRALFSDVLGAQPGADFFLQRKDESWGEFLDLAGSEQEIQDRAVFRAQLVAQVGCIHMETHVIYAVCKLILCVYLDYSCCGTKFTYLTSVRR